MKLHFQPEYDFKSDAVVGAEALLRRDYPELGRISPATCASLAECSDLIFDLDSGDFYNACKQIKDWRDRGVISKLNQVIDRNGIINRVIETNQVLDVVEVAEAVEELEQLNELKKMGSKSAQGVSFSKPIPVSDVETYIQEQVTTGKVVNAI